MYLTDSELRALDMADVHAICESMPAYKDLSTVTKTEYFLAMMHATEGQEINPFQELMLAEGVILWKERKFMDSKITTWITPEAIDKTFSRMRETVQKLQTAQVEITMAKMAVDEARAKMEDDPDFKWGKNDTEREAQVTRAYPNVVRAVKDANLKAQKLSDERELIVLDLQQIRIMIDFFKAFHDSGE
jgi:hypothetical protein